MFFALTCGVSGRIPIVKARGAAERFRRVLGLERSSLSRVVFQQGYQLSKLVFGPNVFLYIGSFPLSTVATQYVGLKSRLFLAVSVWFSFFYDAPGGFTIY